MDGVFCNEEAYATKYERYVYTKYYVKPLFDKNTTVYVLSLWVTPRTLLLNMNVVNVLIDG